MAFTSSRRKEALLYPLKKKIKHKDGPATSINVVNHHIPNKQLMSDVLIKSHMFTKGENPASLQFSQTYYLS
jgi:hypothetical protein